MDHQLGGMLLLTVLLTFVGVAMVVDAAVSAARRWCARQILVSWRRFGPCANRATAAAKPRDHGIARSCHTSDYSPSRGRSRSAYARAESIPAQRR